MKHYLLFYTFIEGYLERRPAFRDAHLKHAWNARERGGLLLAGALANPTDTGVLLFGGESPEVAAVFARNDPYVVNGLVTTWKVREWTTVVGDAASFPVYPPGHPAAKG